MKERTVNILLFSFAMILLGCNASTFLGFCKSLSNDNKTCQYDEELMLPVGETIQVPGQCCSITCCSYEKDNERLMYHGQCCGSVGIDERDQPKCYVTETDLSKNYPDCCPTIKCGNDVLD